MSLPAPVAPEVVVTSLSEPVVSPRWARKFNAQVMTPTELEERGTLPTITLVRASRPSRLLGEERFLGLLARRISSSKHYAVLLFLFEKPATQAKPALTSLLQALPRSERVDVDLAFGPEGAESSLHEALAKVRAWAGPPEGVRSDPLADAAGALRATRDLRAASGRLSASRVADVFGVSRSQLAEWLGRSRQSVSKTPDAESLQPGLAPFDQIARLRAVLSDDDFRGWLRMQNEHLGGARPIEWLQQGRCAEIAELSEDMLTGSAA